MQREIPANRATIPLQKRRRMNFVKGPRLGVSSVAKEKEETALILWFRITRVTEGHKNSLLAKMIG